MSDLELRRYDADAARKVRATVEEVYRTSYAEAIECGREVAQRALPDLLSAIETARRTHANPLRRLWSSALARASA